MEYHVEYVNPSHSTIREKVEKFNGLGIARAFVRQGRQYPGSFELIRVTKITPKGVRTEIQL